MSLSTGAFARRVLGAFFIKYTYYGRDSCHDKACNNVIHITVTTLWKRCQIWIFYRQCGFYLCILALTGDRNRSVWIHVLMYICKYVNMYFYFSVYQYVRRICVYNRNYITHSHEIHIRAWGHFRELIASRCALCPIRPVLGALASQGITFEYACRK